MKSNNIILFVIVLILLSSCSRSFDEKVAEHLDKSCSDFSNPYNCKVNLNEVTDFEWDSLYVFASMTMPDEISKVIGFNCECTHVKDNYTRIVFTKGNKIIYENEFYSLGAKIQFRSFNKNDKTIHYSKNQAVFYALKKGNTLSEGYFFDLYPIEGIREPKYREERKDKPESKQVL